MERSFTAGAERALTCASRLAARTQSVATGASHLLAALADDESRAAAILARHGLTRVRIDDVFPELAIEPDDEAQTVDPVIARENALSAAILEARRYAANAGRHTETGTEHLLYGLAAVESPVAELLGRHGLTPARLEEEVVRRTGFRHDPIGVDVRIEWRDPAASDETDTFRILDAAANRTREGLRVAEDFTRFILDDRHLSGLLKELRHELAKWLKVVESEGMLASRDTLRDVGTGISTEAERTRRIPLDVARAALRRAEEGMRTIEEFGKLVDPEMAANVGQLRYCLYTVEKAVLTADAARRRLAGCNLYLLLTEAACPRGSGPVVREALAAGVGTAGVGMVQIREKSMPDGELLAHVRRVREWTRDAGALLIVNDRPDLALLADADGVHVGQNELPVREARRIVGPRRLVGVSTHDIEQARQAVLDGADYLGVGPTFPSQTKKFADFPGLNFVQEVAEEISLPWFAIGGIDTENVGEVVAAGATRIAVSSAICAAEDPAESAQRLIRCLTSG